MTNEFAFASGEINEILKYLSSDKVNKIPIKLRNLFKEAEINNYQPHIDPSKRIIEQNISQKTKDILVILYRKYWSDISIRNQIDDKLIQNERKYQEEQRIKYNPDNIFKDREIKVEQAEEPKEMIVVKENEGIISRIINRIKWFFKK